MSIQTGRGQMCPPPSSLGLKQSKDQKHKTSQVSIGIRFATTKSCVQAHKVLIINWINHRTLSHWMEGGRCCMKRSTGMG